VEHPLGASAERRPIRISNGTGPTVRVRQTSRSRLIARPPPPPPPASTPLHSTPLSASSLPRVPLINAFEPCTLAPVHAASYLSSSSPASPWSGGFECSSAAAPTTAATGASPEPASPSRGIHLETPSRHTKLNLIPTSDRAG
jgi:hypothetical protein